MTLQTPTFHWLPSGLRAWAPFKPSADSSVWAAGRALLTLRFKCLQSIELGQPFPNCSGIQVCVHGPLSSLRQILLCGQQDVHSLLCALNAYGVLSLDRPFSIAAEFRFACMGPFQAFGRFFCVG